MSVISTPFNNRVPSALRVAYPWMTNQSFVDFWADKYVPASTLAVNYVARMIVLGHTPTVQQVEGLETFYRGCIAAGDDLVAKRSYVFGADWPGGGSLAASATNLWTATADMTWVGNPTVNSGYLTFNGTTQYGYTNDPCTSFMSNDSASLGFYSHEPITTSKYVSTVYVNTTSCLGMQTGASSPGGHIAWYGLTFARTSSVTIEGGHSNANRGLFLLNQRAAGSRVCRIRPGGAILHATNATAGVGTPPNCSHIIAGVANSDVTRTASLAGPLSGWHLGEGFASDAAADAYGLRFHNLLVALGAPLIP